MKRSLFFISFFLFSYTTYAEINTARTLGFGGAAALNPYSVGAALKYNPANLSIHADLEVGGGYGRGELPGSPQEIDQKGYYFWAKDSSSSSFKSRRNRRVKRALNDEHEAFPFAAAAAYTDYQAGGLDYTAYSLSLSKVVRRNLSMGLSGRYFDGSNFNAPLGKKWMVDFGAVYRLSKRLNLGVSWRNLNDVPIAEEVVRIAGSYSIYELARLYFDVDYSLEDVEDEFSYGAGFEAKIREFFAFRSGYFTSGAEDKDFLGLGLSFLGPRLQLHYGVRIEMDSKAALHSVDFSLPLW